MATCRFALKAKVRDHFWSPWDATQNSPNSGFLHDSRGHESKNVQNMCQRSPFPALDGLDLDFDGLDLGDLGLDVDLDGLGLDHDDVDLDDLDLVPRP